MPTDDPTDPTEPTPARKRVSGSQLLDAIEALPARVAAAVGGSSADPDDDGSRDTGDLPPVVTFEGEPEPTPEEIEETADDLPETPPEPGQPARRRSGFPRRKR